MVSILLHVVVVVGGGAADDNVDADVDGAVTAAARGPLLLLMLLQ